MRKVSLTIGIPAHNEEANIVNLFPKAIGSSEDAYMHYYAVKEGFKISYNKKAVVRYKNVLLQR